MERNKLWKVKLFLSAMLKGLSAEVQEPIRTGCDIFTEKRCLSFRVCLHPESTDEDVDKLHCLNHSGSSATYSDYSPSQGSSGSSNPPANTHSHAHQHTPALPAPNKDQAPQTHWTNRYRHTHACFMFSFIITSSSLWLSIISFSLLVLPDFNHLWPSPVSPICPISQSILLSLHLSVF